MTSSDRTDTDRPTCHTCDGCGQVADTDDREPWTAWESLPPGSDMAVRMGLVKPIPCPDCQPAAEPEYRFTEDDILTRITDPHKIDAVFELGWYGSGQVVKVTPRLKDHGGVYDVDDYATETFLIEITRIEDPR